MFLPFFDPTYLLFVLPAFLLGTVASLLLNHWTKKYSQENIINNFIGVEIIDKISQKYNLRLSIADSGQMLSSSYDPRLKIINISNDIAHGSTISGTGILAHELGHAIQHQNGNFLAGIRTAIVPVVNIGTNIGYFLLIAGLVLSFSTLSWIGLFLFSLTTVFVLITLPLEIDASIKANKILRGMQLCYPNEMPKINKILFAAALTYVAALFQSLGQLLYFFLQVKGVSSRKD
jgi:Zn-dependent membrane protease YugP